MTWLNFVFAAAGMVLSPFGSVPDLLKKENPWHGFQPQDPVLLVVRVQKIPSTQCKEWIDAVLADASGKEVEAKTWDSAWNEWKPWKKEDKEAIEKCDDFPCDVKLNKMETSLMENASPSAKRFQEYLQLVQKRSEFYRSTQKRGGYEFPGDPVDPWKIFEKQGFVTSATLPSNPTLRLRSLDFAPGKIREIRQVIDRRTAKSASGTEATVWVRDAYTDHYFDSWGEWTTISCNPPSGNEVLLVQTLVVELDLLKKTDLPSRIMRGKMRSSVKDNGIIYLDRAYSRYQKAVSETQARTTEKAHSH